MVNGRVGGTTRFQPFQADWGLHDTAMLPQDDALHSPMAGGGTFHTTHWSVVLAARAGHDTEAEAALETLCRSYWYPLYAYLRREGWSEPDAQDLTQGFFEHLLVHRTLDRVEREKVWLSAAVRGIGDQTLAD